MRSEEKTDYIINEEALLEDTINILENHHGFEEEMVRGFLETNPLFMEKMVIEMYEAQTDYIAEEIQKLIG